MKILISMMISMGLVLAPFALSAHEPGSSPWLSACDCLTMDVSEVGHLSARRIDINGISFKVFERARKCERASPDSRLVVWDYWGYQLVYSVTFFGRWDPTRMNDSSYCSVPGFDGAVWAAFIDDGITLRFNDPSDFSNDAHIISVTTEDLELSCQWGAIVLGSFMQIDLVENLKILAVDVQRGFFVYENELGLRRVGSLGQRISRGGGEVLSIESNGVLVRVSDSFGFAIGHQDIQRRDVFLEVQTQ